MNQRFRFHHLASVVSLAGAVAWLACGEDYGDGTVTPLPDRTQTGDDAGTESGSSNGVDGEASSGPDGDASRGPDADAAIDAAGCCDCDGDGYLRRSCTNAVVIDCDDSVFGQHPNADFSFALPVAPNVGDWDCNGTVEKKIAVNVTCPTSPPCNAAGFATDPGCGMQADLVQCAVDLILGCKTNVVTNGARQSCK